MPHSAVLVSIQKRMIILSEPTSHSLKASKTAANSNACLLPIGPTKEDALLWSTALYVFFLQDRTAEVGINKVFKCKCAHGNLYHSFDWSCAKTCFRAQSQAKTPLPRAQAARWAAR